MNLEEYKKLISRDFPDLVIKDVKYLGSGWDNAAVLVNDEYVFRFLRGLFDKKYPLKTEDIEKEVSILNYLQKMVPFAVPKPEFWTHDYNYFGYRMIPGTLWDQVGGDHLSDEYLRSWVETRSEISASIPPDQAHKLLIPKYRTNKNEQLVNKYLADKGADSEVKQLAKEAMDYVLNHLKTTRSWHFIHEDLQMSNCLVNPQTKKIRGVIDWLEAEVAPIEAEFYFWSKYGKETLHKVAKMQEEYDGTRIDLKLARCIHQFYIVADYQDFKARGFDKAAAHKWSQIKAYL